LASFYWRFVKDFSTIAFPLTGIVKKAVGFKWGEEQENAFSLLQSKLISAPLLSLPDFHKAFEIECDASGIDIGAILMQENGSSLILVRNSMVQLLTIPLMIKSCMQSCRLWRLDNIICGPESLSYILVAMSRSHKLITLTSNTTHKIV